MRIYYTIGCLLVSLSLFLFSSCEKGPVHNSIEQHWRLERFTILETGEIITCSNLFFGITHMVTEVAEKPISDGVQDLTSSKGYGAFIARTSYKDNGTILVLSDFRENGYNTDTKIPATAQQLCPFGINNPVETIFSVLSCTHKRLILQSDYARLELKKF